MWEESRTESFRCQHHLQTEVMLSGPSFGCTNKQRVQLEANVILKILSHDVRHTIIILYVSVLSRMWKQNLQIF